MQEQLKRGMAMVESGGVLDVDSSLEFAVLAGLGSKYLAVGTPMSLGLIQCGNASDSLIACHEMQFGPLDLRVAEVAGIRLEEAMACDIVCFPCGLQFDRAWIADATHLNILQSGAWSAAMQSLVQHEAITMAGTANEVVAQCHGSLSDVITGRVSGRVGEELTGLLCCPKDVFSAPI